MTLEAALNVFILLGILSWMFLSGIHLTEEACGEFSVERGIMAEADISSTVYTQELRINKGSGYCTYFIAINPVRLRQTLDFFKDEFRMLRSWLTG